MRESYDQRRRFLFNAFEEMGIDCFEPQGAFYTFPSIKRFGMSSDEFAHAAFGGGEGGCGAWEPPLETAERDFVRISYAYSLKGPEGGPGAGLSSFVDSAWMERQ